MMTEKLPLRFWMNWTLHHTWVILVSYVASLVIILMFVALFGISMDEFGTPLQQLIMQTAGGAVLGLGVGLLQFSLLKSIFHVPRLWIWLSSLGFILAEIVAGTICWMLDFNRMELRFIELNALPESLIFALAGLLTGILQWFILKKKFTGSFYWIISSAFGWGLCILMMGYDQILPEINKIALSSLVMVLVFILGAALYGAITGAALLALKKKEDAQGQLPGQ